MAEAVLVDLVKYGSLCPPAKKPLALQRTTTWQALVSGIRARDRQRVIVVSRIWKKLIL